MMQMSIKTMELQKASLEAMRGSAGAADREGGDGITLYYGSGSPYAWRVQLALEHKALAYERKVLSFAAGDTRKPEFLALNPRHRVPVDRRRRLRALRVERDRRVPGRSLSGARRAAVPRRRAQARAGAPPDLRGRQLLRQGDRPGRRRGVLRRSPKSATPAKLAAGERGAATRSTRSFARYHARRLPRRPAVGRGLRALSAGRRSSIAARSSCRTSMPTALLTPQLAAWKARIEALPYFDATVSAALEEVRSRRCSSRPPPSPTTAPFPAIRVRRASIPRRTCALSANRNPDFAWSDAPAGTRSFALVCHDPDVPSRGDDVNQEGRVVPASLPRVDFFHWVLDRPAPSTRGDRARRAFRTA